MTQASERFLTQVEDVAEQLQSQLATRLQTVSGERSLAGVREAIEVANGRELSDREFIELYAQTVACAAAVLAHSGGTFAEATTRQWLLAQDHPLWPGIVRDCMSLLSGESNPETGMGTGHPCPGASPRFRAENSTTDEDATLTPARSDQATEIADMDDFFERFLKHHDAARRMKHGVYYTPRPLVAHIVQQVDRFLVDEFQLEDGLADTSSWRDVAERQPGLALPPGVSADAPFVTMLDPALGTGIFLVEVIDCIYGRLKTKWSAAGADDGEVQRRWNAYVPRYLLPRMFGFELMLPACVLAVLRVAAKLAETRFAFAIPGTIQVHLANTLAGPPRPRGLFCREDCELVRAVHAGQDVCSRQPFTVVIGNPPFSGISQESGRWIIDLLKGHAVGGTRVASYYEVDGQPLAERKHWLQDDYVKFLRYAHWKIESAGCGIIGFVTNHGYLDNPTFRGLRQQLLRDFPRITVLDLHGNRKKKEQTPEGLVDENVFGIDTGIAVGLFRRPLAATEPSRVWHGELWGDADAKLARLTPAISTGGAASTPASLNTKLLAPQSPLYLFVARDETRLQEYECGDRLSDLMPIHVTAPVTARDHFVVAFDRPELLERLQNFRDLTILDDEIRQRYFTRTRSAKYASGDTRGWDLSAARRRMAAAADWAEHVKPCWYRPFDQRLIYWADEMIDWPRSQVTQHLLAGPNLALIARRQMLPSQPCNYFWITDTLAIDGVIRSDNRGSESIFPLYLYHEEQGVRRCRANFSSPFITAAIRRLQLQWIPVGSGDLESTFGPEDLLYYCYAQVFSPIYRTRYADLLRCEFPRIFLPPAAPLFRTWCGLGKQLAERHLLRHAATTAPVQFWQSSGAADAGVVGRGFPKYEDGRVLLNAQTWFESVPQEVWDYQVGGHQVCRKWWHDRRGRVWRPDDITCYTRIVAAVHDTLRLASEIDQTIEHHGGWSAVFGLR